MLQPNLIEFINTLMVFATQINLWRLVGRHECEAVWDDYTIDIVGNSFRNNFQKQI